MRAKLEGLKPTASKRTLILLSGLLWLAMGAVMVSFAVGWMGPLSGRAQGSVAAVGLSLALLIHHLAFLRVADRNLQRLLPLSERRCLFAFQSWKSYILILAMMALGVALRHSPLPRWALAVIYIAIGAALILSSVRYLRHGLTRSTP